MADSLTGKLEDLLSKMNILSNLDLKLFFLFITLSLLLIIVSLQSRHHYLLFGILIAASSIFWFKRKGQYGLRDQEVANKLYQKISQILFFLILTTSIYILYTRPEIYTRPLFFFIVASFLPICILIQIINSSKDEGKYILLQLAIFWIFISWSVTSLYPSLIGVDTPWHDHFSAMIISSGVIPEGFVYSQLPIFDLLMGIPQIILNIDYKASSFIAVTIVCALCNTFLIYLISKKMFNYKVALFASLCTLLVSNGLYFLVAPVPTTIATSFLLFAIYLMQHINEQGKFSRVLLVLLFSISIVLSHPLVSLIFLFLLTMGVVINILSARMANYERNNISITFLSLFSILMFAWWSYVSGQINIVRNIIEVGLRADLFHQQPIISSQYLLTIPEIESLLLSLGLFVTFSFSIQGTLLMVSKFGNNRTIFMAMSAISIVAIGYTSNIVGVDIISERWIYIGSMLMTIPLGVSLFLIVKDHNNLIKPARSIFVMGVLYALILLSISSSGANPDNDTIFPNTTVQKALTENEMCSFKFISSVSGGPIGGDRYYIENYMKPYFNNTQMSDDYIYNRELDKHEGIFMLRFDILNKPFHLYSGIFKIDYDLKGALDTTHFNTIYYSNSVCTYYSI